MTHYTSTDWEQCWQKMATILNRFPQPIEQKNLQKFTTHLLTWNQTYNLIGPTATTNLLERHILNSVSIAPFLNPTARIADMGAGGGFPGIILAVLAHPSQTFHLYEASHKKTRFLNFIVSELQLQNRVTIYRQQIEQASQTKHSYDFVTSRALADLQLIGKLARHLLQPGGISLALKGHNIQEELNQFLLSSEAKYFHTPKILATPENPEGVIIQMQKVSRETGSNP